MRKRLVFTLCKIEKTISQMKKQNIFKKIVNKYQYVKWCRATLFGI